MDELSNLTIKVQIDISDALRKLEVLKNINVNLDNKANVDDIVDSLSKNLKITTINCR